MNKIKEKRSIILSVIAGFIIGFLIGRTFIENPTQKTKKIVKYEKSDYVKKDTLFFPKEKEVIKWKNRVKKDTIFLPSKVLYKDGEKIFVTDTAKSIDDYFLTRKYSLDFSNDTIGTFKVDAEVNQNRLVKSYSYINPSIRSEIETKTIYRVPALQFYGMIGSSVDLRTNQVQLGVDLKQKFLIGVCGVRMDDKLGYTLNFGVKF